MHQQHQHNSTTQQADCAVVIQHQHNTQHNNTQQADCAVCSGLSPSAIPPSVNTLLSEKEVRQAWRSYLVSYKKASLLLGAILCYLVNYSLLLAAILCCAAVVSLPLSVSTCCSLCLPHTQKSVLFFQIFFVSLSVLLHQHPPC